MEKSPLILLVAVIAIISHVSAAVVTPHDVQLALDCIENGNQTANYGYYVEPYGSLVFVPNDHRSIDMSTIETLDAVIVQCMVECGENLSMVLESNDGDFPTPSEIVPLQGASAHDIAANIAASEHRIDSPDLRIQHDDNSSPV